MLDVASDTSTHRPGSPPRRARRWRMPWFTAAMSLVILIGVLVSDVSQRGELVLAVQPVAV